MNLPLRLALRRIKNSFYRFHWYESQNLVITLTLLTVSLGERSTYAMGDEECGNLLQRFVEATRPTVGTKRAPTELEVTIRQAEQALLPDELTCMVADLRNALRPAIVNSIKFGPEWIARPAALSLSMRTRHSAAAIILGEGMRAQRVVVIAHDYRRANHLVLDPFKTYLKYQPRTGQGERRQEQETPVRSEVWLQWTHQAEWNKLVAPLLPIGYAQTTTSPTTAASPAADTAMPPWVFVFDIPPSLKDEESLAFAKALLEASGQ